MTRKLNPKSKSAHTPTPYQYEEANERFKRVYQRDRVYEIGNNALKVGIGTIIGEANAAFIVRACNSHEKLLEACKQAIMSLNSILNGEEEAMNNAIIDVKDIEAAIAEAEK